MPAEAVLLKAPGADDVALVGAIPFEQGRRYLVPATEGSQLVRLHRGVVPQYEAVVQEALEG